MAVGGGWWQLVAVEVGWWQLRLVGRQDSISSDKGLAIASNKNSNNTLTVSPQQATYHAAHTQTLVHSSAPYKAAHTQTHIHTHLLLQQLLLSADVASVALCQHVLAVGRNSLTGNDLVADARL